MDTTVMLGHGSGGTMMKRIIDDVFFAAYAGDELLRGDDAAVLPAPAPCWRRASPLRISSASAPPWRNARRRPACIWSPATRKW